MELRTVDVTHYIMPLREGGSLPTLAKADGDSKHAIKLWGAGYGTEALIAELIGGEIVRMLGLRLPELVFLNLDEAFGCSEGDEEIQDLLQENRGLNLGLYFLSDALPFGPIATKIDGELASQVVWLDALLTNVGRTMKNADMLMWHRELWLIDHSASLFFQRSWVNWHKHVMSPFTQIKDHALSPQADKLEEVDVEFQVLLTSEKIREVVNLIPDGQVEWRDKNETPQDIRDIYYQFLIERMEHSETFVKEAKHAGEAYL